MVACGDDGVPMRSMDILGVGCGNKAPTQVAFLFGWQPLKALTTNNWRNRHIAIMGWCSSTSKIGKALITFCYIVSWVGAYGQQYLALLA